MSLQTFKANMLRYMQNQEGIDSFDDFANKLTTEYDFAVKRGFQTINNIPVQTGNTKSMESFVKIACQTALTVQEGNHTFIDDIGKAIIMYWTGTTLVTGIPPVIPATGAIQNITTTSAIVLSPGQWSPIGPTSPTDDSGLFLDMLLSGIQSHLPTVEFLYSTISLYPSVPSPIPAPGVLQSKGYTIPPASPSTGTPSVVEPSFFESVIQKLTEIFSTDDTMSPEQIQAAQVEAAAADSVANDTSLPQAGRTSAKEYSNLKKSEIQSGKLNATQVELSDEELEEIEKSTPEEAKCETGARIVAIAKKDIGILETGTPPGKNYGGFPGGIQKNQRGRIDDMFDNVGLDNQAKVRKTGSGYYWCAAAVATWWQEAGLETPNGGASCDNWMKWGKQKGYWSNKPKIGAAVLYGSPSDAHHIGIVAGITPTGGIITIEGNTSGGGFDRNGCGVFQKAPRRYLGFVNPPDCV